MALTLRLRSVHSIPIEIDGFAPATTRGKSATEFQRWPIVQGNRTVPLAELFEVHGSPDGDEVRFEGDLRCVHGLGVGLKSGTILIEGDVGRHLGAEMSGGRIEVRGSASDWAGAEMKGGSILIRSTAGDGAGGAYRGSRQGMTGGTLIIQGDAGSEIGRGMRRGTILVGGSCQGGLGYDMLAGSIVVAGTCGPHPGAGMRRGTLVLLGETPPLLPSFRRGGLHRPEMMPLLFRSIQRHGGQLDPNMARADFEYFHGDLLSLGRGEILVRREP